jgi:adenosylcobinamide amidohydrolase/ABC-type Fe3+-hydroxamate transport system substrate-binding protein
MAAWYTCRTIDGGIAVKKLRILALSFILLVGKGDAAEVTDDARHRHIFTAPPSRVVSLLPSVTEVICLMGASDALKGVTYHDTHFAGTAGKTIVGGAFTPQYKIINSLSPDLLIVAPRDFEQAAAGRGDNSWPILVIDDNVPLTEAEHKIRLLGEIFGREDGANRIISDNRSLMETVRLKAARIPEGKKQRTILLYMGPDGPLTPGKGTFQNEIIEAAGGITGNFGEGPAVPISLEQWIEFSPDFVFTGTSEFKKVGEFLKKESWRDVPAVRQGRLSAYPDALVSRAAAHVGYFASWLSSEIYADDFADSSKLVHPQEVLSEKDISAKMAGIPYVAGAKITDSRMMDFVHRTLIVDFKRPQRIVSTVDGERDGIAAVGNAYSPVPAWSVYHKLGFERYQEDLFEILKLDPEKTDIMLTGADMNNAAVTTASYRDMTVTAIVTGGVEGNALRSSRDVGAWYEPGTINIIVMTNHKLSEQAATRAVITITEAKTAALWDMDIRSSQTPLANPATGTGTDTVIVVSGEGRSLNWTGGHAKMGELIADVVYRGVLEALLKQNGKTSSRGIVERLEERGVGLEELDPDIRAGMEELLISPEYDEVRGFIEAAFSLSDASGMGQISNLVSFGDWARLMAEKIAGGPVKSIENLIVMDELPEALDTALDALATGLKHRSANR